jgi:hypothetical protein
MKGRWWAVDLSVFLEVWSARQRRPPWWGHKALQSCKGGHLGRGGVSVSTFGGPHGGGHGERQRLPFEGVVVVACRRQQC